MAGTTDIAEREPRARSSRRGLTRTGAIRKAPTAVYSVASFCEAHGISEAPISNRKRKDLALLR